MAKLGLAARCRSQIQQPRLIGGRQPVVLVTQVHDKDRRQCARNFILHPLNLLIHQPFGKPPAHIVCIAGIHHRIGVVLAIVTDRTVRYIKNSQTNTRLRENGISQPRRRFERIQQTGSPADRKSADDLTQLLPAGSRIGKHPQPILRTKQPHRYIRRKRPQPGNQCRPCRIYQRQIARKIQHHQQHQIIGRGTQPQQFGVRSIQRNFQIRTRHRIAGRAPERYTQRRTLLLHRRLRTQAKRHRKNSKEAYQKLNLIPICITRPPREPMIRPALTFGAEAGPIIVSGSFQLA